MTTTQAEPTDETAWDRITDIARWLDEQSPVADSMEALKMRVLKIGEEYGEACEALLTPGPLNTPGLVTELCDVILTASVALFTADRASEQLFSDALVWPAGFSEEPVSKLILAIGQEYGRACQALIGVTAYNPRKGASHTMADLVTNLGDLIRAAVVALDDVDQDAAATFAANLERVHNRSLGVTRLPDEAPHS
ncbi:hypothetical protein N7U49_21490 [Streptomyces sp. AD2-2]|nr:hypothetical protein N7U49_21490 [Streptomyces sp. AD2-2]